MKEKKKIIKSKSDIIKIVFIVVIIIWVICFLVDYTRARKSEEPMFCIHKTTKTYSDGTVFVCTGMGYKTYIYNRSSINAKVEFGPFFLKERT